MFVKGKCAVVVAAIAFALSSGCASTGSASNQDPWEGMNRAIFSFNDTLDTYALKPVAQGYTAVTPDVVETGISNFFSNLLEIRNVLNDVLQWKWKQAGNDSGRLLVNSTIGIAGLFDVAKNMNLPKSEGEDFGQTLAVWGAGEGPYLMLPFLGPSNLRDTVGLPMDWYSHPDTYIDHVATRNASKVFRFIVERSELLDAENFISGDKYIFMREAYRQRREYLILDGEPAQDDFDSFDDFGGDYDDYDYEEE